jgi:branched-chain amino acid transport system ATP-binding protein
MTSRTLLEVKGLTAFYGQLQILHGLDFSLKESSVAAILGANGAGKTTTLRAISGLVRTGGEIIFDGHRIDGRQPEQIARAGIAHVPEGRGTFARLSVEENLRASGYLRTKAEVTSGIERAFGLFPRLKERRRQQAGLLSGGEQQMLAISRALMLQPRLLLLDEPSFGLAPLIVSEIFEILRTIKEQSNVSVLLIEQSSQHALGLADHAYVIESGKVVVSGPADEIARDEAVQHAYLGS